MPIGTSDGQTFENSFDHTYAMAGGMPSVEPTPQDSDEGSKGGLKTVDDLSWQQKALLGVLRFAEKIEPADDARTAIKFYNDAIQRGRTEPFTEKDIPPSTLGRFKTLVEGKIKDTGKTSGSIDYPDYKKYSPELNSNIIGGFQYNKDEGGNINIKDTYDFNANRGDSLDHNPIAQTLGLLLAPVPLAATAGRDILPDTSQKGVPVNINIPPPEATSEAPGKEANGGNIIPPVIGNMVPSDVVSKAGQTPPQANTNIDQQYRDAGYAMLPDYLKPLSGEEFNQRSKTFANAEPGKVPENDPQKNTSENIAKLGLDIATSIGAPEKSLFLGIGGARRLLGDETSERLFNRVLKLMGDGRPDNEIFEKTGVSFGADEMARYELNDFNSRLKLENIPMQKPRDAGQASTWTSVDTANGEQLRMDLPSPWDVDNPKAKKITLGDIFDHPDLYKAYPELKDVPVTNTGMSMDINGALSRIPSSDPADPKYYIQLRGYRTEDEVKSTLLHEIQHWIQMKEGMNAGGNTHMFTPQEVEPLRKRLGDLEKRLGSEVDDKFKQFGVDYSTMKTILTNPKYYSKSGTLGAWDPALKNWKRLQGEDVLQVLQHLHDNEPETMNNLATLAKAKKNLEYIDSVAYDKYHSLAGEVEARNVQKRKDYLPEESAQVHPTVTESVPREQQIVKFRK